jgi:hypothetical protein
MKITDIDKNIVKETTSAGSVASVAKPLGSMQRRKMYNADGTMKNGLDQDNIFGTEEKTSKKKKR